MFDGKRILVTGGTGSFGRHLCKRLVTQHKPAKVVVFSRDELKQHDMGNDPVLREHSDIMRYFLGDVRDLDRLRMAFRNIDYVVHAAALKQIPAAEYNPFECIRTNVHGAENVVTAAIETKVERVLALSTDKAANPVNLYGASKLAADKIFAAAKNLVGSGDPVFGVVRYGNVLGSRGSVVPFFRSLIEAGTDHLPITDERMTRFWITLEQGVDFVLSCFPMMRSGEIFVPKIPSMTVVDLAKTMAPDLPLKSIGVRPGEKLHEVMISEDDSRSAIELPDRFIIPPVLYSDRFTYHPEQGPVRDGFIYSSDRNDEWMTPDRLRDIIRDLDAFE